MRQSIWANTPSASVTLVGAHRGASAFAAENTAEAFEAAIATGADFIETDIRLTRDGVPVACHDPNLSRICGDPREVADLDLSELRAVHPAVMTIVDALDLIGERASVLLDTKLYEQSELERCAEVLESRLATGRVAFGVRSLDVFDILHRRLPNCPMLGLLRDIGDYPALAARGSGWGRLWESDASPENITKLQRLGLQVVVMTGYPADGSVGVIEPEALVELLRRGPDAVMINDAELAVELVKSAAQLA